MFQLIEQLFDFSKWGSLTPLGQSIKIFFIIFFICLCFCVLSLIIQTIKYVVKFFKFIFRK